MEQFAVSYQVNTPRVSLRSVVSQHFALRSSVFVLRYGEEREYSVFAIPWTSHHRIKENLVRFYPTRLHAAANLRGSTRLYTRHPVSPSSSHPAFGLVYFTKRMRYSDVAFEVIRCKGCVRSRTDIRSDFRLHRCYFTKCPRDYSQVPTFFVIQSNGTTQPASNVIMRSSRHRIKKTSRLMIQTAQYRLASF